MEIRTNQRTFDFRLTEHEAANLALAIKNSRGLAGNEPAYALREQLVKALGYEPTPDIY